MLLLRQYGGFSPLNLFANSVKGAWFDPSDVSTLFQDSAGTTPVTAVEQPVGLMLDKSQPLSASIVLNGSFNDASVWSVGGGWSIGGGQATHAPGTTDTMSQPLTLTAGAYYLATFTITSYSGSGGVQIRFGGGSTVNGPIGSAVGTYILPMQAVAGNNTIAVVASSTVAATIDNVSLQLIPGNHATQATAGNRPTYRARYNLLLATATLSTQNVTTAAKQYTLSFSGAGTITLSGTSTGVYSAGTNTFTPTAGTLTLTVAGSVNNADLRLSSDTNKGPAYQSVTDATHYDAVGFLPYLSFNGTSSAMATAAIGFTAAQMSVFAGVTKLSDAATQIVAETSTNSSSTAGSFYVGAAVGATATFSFAPGGTTQNILISPTTYASPITEVFTGLSDITAPLVTLRLNQTQTTSSATQGTGTFTSQPIYIGSRAGTTFFLNGNLYSLIVRGASSTAAEIASTEAFVNSKCAAY